MNLLRKDSKPRHRVPEAPRRMDVRSMPYELRLRNYERDKEELFYRMKNLSSAEIREQGRALIEKWQI